MSLAPTAAPAGLDFARQRTRVVCRGRSWVRGELCMLDFGLTDSTGLAVGDVDGGLSRVIEPPASSGKRPRVFGLIDQDAVAQNDKGWMVVGGIVDVMVAANTPAGSALFANAAINNGQRVLGVTLETRESSDGLVKCLWSGEEGLGEYFDPDGGNGGGGGGGELGGTDVDDFVTVIAGAGWDVIE